MQNGIFVEEVSRHNCPNVKYEETDNYELVLPAVFKTKALLDKASAKLFTIGGHVWRGEPGSMSGPEYAKYISAKVSRVTSEMTVLQWLQTPWHYEYLPYQPMRSVFKDGECYRSGCSRCSRPFYEYPYLYAHYHFSLNKTEHWVHSYWDKKDRGANEAPLPFHEPEFWTKKPVNNSSVVVSTKTDEAQKEVRKRDGGVLKKGGVVENAGFHNWPTHLFLLGYEETEEGYRKVKATKDAKPLVSEWKKREKLEHLSAHYKNNRPWTFRRYINHTYDPDHKQTDGKDGYDALVQGVVRKKGVKICYGMKGYKLMRSIKYGNVCRDCANTLTRAPHLYLRMGVDQFSVLATTRGAAGIKGRDTWWLQFENAQLRGRFAHLKFDPWFIYVQTPRSKDANLAQRNLNYTYKQLVEKKMLANSVANKRKAGYLSELMKQRVSKDKLYSEVFGEEPGGELEALIKAHLDVAMDVQQHCNPTRRNEGRPITKVIKPPEVYVQKYWDEDSTKWQEGSKHRIEDAGRILEALVNWLDQTYVPHEEKAHVASGGARSIKPVETSLRLSVNERDKSRNNVVFIDPTLNRGLRDVLHELQYQMAHKEAYDREARAPKFDPDLTRLETREMDKLTVVQMVMPSVDNKLKAAQRKEWVYKKATSSWQGDKFVENAIGQARIHPAPKVQTRKLTQSRLFITYSLHRRVFSELEARAVLEKMADAVRCLFGKDEELCKIIVFGKKLMEDQFATVDSVARKVYQHITEPRKKEAEERFYGDLRDNSYVYDTFETHVESVTVDAGMEIGPTYHHPHFHLLLTINHWSYVQVDTFLMKATLEKMFKGTHPDYFDENGAPRYLLVDGAGLPFYTDNENPYVDIKLYPSDNWAEVVSAYVRKGADKETMMALRARTTGTTMEDRDIS
tara:strand:- start:1830 stop:4547 length:2718 start_codon:yes stop_codon:yes gene_type:complete